MLLPESDGAIGEAHSGKVREGGIVLYVLALVLFPSRSVLNRPDACRSETAWTGLSGLGG